MAKRSLSITIPIKWASGQIRHGRGFTYWPKSTRAYKDALDAALLPHKTDQFNEGPIAVWVTFIRPRPKSAPKREWFTVKPDLDNLEKPTLDCMSGVLFGDDAQIIEKHSYKVYGENWRLEITIEPMGGA